VVFGADQRADRGWADRAVHRGQLLDVGCGDATRGRGTFGCPLVDVQRQFVEAQGVIGDPLLVGEPVTDQHMHDGEHQGDVGAGSGLDEPVGRIGGDGADRIEHHDPSAVGTGLLDRRPQMSVGELGVGAPQDDQLRVAQLRRVETLGRTHRHLHPGAHSWAADIS
jgi:hypothetical protein